MGTIPEALHRRVQALLRKAASPAATSDEAKAYADKAAELIAKYGIEDIAATGADPNERPTDRIVEAPGTYSRERANLVYLVAEALGCKCVLMAYRVGAPYRVHCFGYERDLARAEVVWTVLLLEMTNALATMQVPYGVTPRTYRRSWLLGFTEMVVRRVEQAERAAVADDQSGPGAAVVVANRASAVTKALSAAYPRPGVVTGRYSRTGYAAGRAAGGRADVGHARVGDRRALGRG